MRSVIAIGAIVLSTLTASAGVVPLLPSALVLDALTKPMEPIPEPGEKTTVQQLAERIEKKAKEAGEQLLMRETGETTRENQKQVAKDLDSLIRELENPPPMPPMPMPPMPMPPMPMPPMGGEPPMPKDGSDGQPPPGQSKRRQREKPMPPMPEKPGEPQGGKPEPKKPEGEGKAGAKPPMPGEAGPQPGKPGGRGTPTLPAAETIAKDFWGHLPEQPREQMMQFFREQYLSKYKQLLPQYYSSLAEKEKAGKK